MIPSSTTSAPQPNAYFFIRAECSASRWIVYYNLTLPFVVQAYLVADFCHHYPSTPGNSLAVPATPVSRSVRPFTSKPRSSWPRPSACKIVACKSLKGCACCTAINPISSRSEEHTSELQSPCKLVCRLLLEKKKRQ